jgi:hypothetical protein
MRGTIPERSTKERIVSLDRFMQGYKEAWERSDPDRLVALFTPDATYHNTPFAEQRGHAAMRTYWERTRLQRDIELGYQVLHEHGRACRLNPEGGATDRPTRGRQRRSAGSSSVGTSTVSARPAANAVYTASSDRRESRFS